MIRRMLLSARVGSAATIVLLMGFPFTPTAAQQMPQATANHDPYPYGIDDASVLGVSPDKWNPTACEAVGGNMNTRRSGTSVNHVCVVTAAHCMQLGWKIVWIQSLVTPRYNVLVCWSPDYIAAHRSSLRRNGQDIR
jgi:hypothetical protein